MMRNRNRVNRDWETPIDGFTWQHVEIEVLMDIRALLQDIEISLRPLRCGRFQSIPNKLERIARNTSKPARAKKLKAVA